MPELPEVETIARTLVPFVAGRRIEAVHVLHSGSWQGGLPPETLVGRRILGVGRRGKLLLLHTGDQTGLAFHLKMTGRLLARPPETRPERHTRVILDLDDPIRLFFDDMRKFGYARGISPDELEAWPFWRKLWAEPLDVGEKAFILLFQARNATIKSLLLNQELLAGIGNIYADESLFRAGIRPDAPGGSLGPERLAVLRRCLIEVLQESIAACGSSIRDYRTAGGDVGAFQNAFRVYGRGGAPCVRCGAALRAGRIAGRSSVWCPRCQT
jgi:formamidopyrimidine-DNA glycosylase